MTVFTGSEPVEEKKEKLPEVIVTPPVAIANEGALPLPEVDAESQNEANSVLCLGALLIWVAFGLFVGGLFFGRHIGRKGAFHGWCGATINDAGGHAERLEQKIEVDPEELYEKIQVPRFGSNRPAVFVHDFRRNLTAIVDVMGRRCFLKELDRQTAAPPRSLIELVSRMESGSFNPHPRVVHETFRIGSQLNRHELLDLGSFVINRHCLHRPVFLLQKTVEQVAVQQQQRQYVRRERRMAQQQEEPLQFSMMASSDAVEVDQILF